MLTVDVKHHFSWLVFYSGCSGPSCYFPSGSFFFVLPLDFHGRLRVMRSLFILGALHGIEASFLVDISLRKLRTAIFKFVWPRRHSLANVGAVVSLLDGPQGCYPAYCVVWFRFRMLRRYHLAYRPGEVAG